MKTRTIPTWLGMETIWPDFSPSRILSCAIPSLVLA